MTVESNVVHPGSILVADDSLYLKIANDPDDVGLLNDVDAMIVPYSVRAELNAAAVDSVRDLLRLSGQLVPRSLLIQSPYMVAEYEGADEAIGSFSLAKYHAFANVARLLGATTVRFQEVKVESENTDWQAKVAAMLPSFGGDADVIRDVAKKLEERLDGHLVFGGGEPDLSAAQEYLLASRLSHDPQLRALVDMRSGSNLLTHYDFTLSGTREASANLTTALQLANAGPVKAVQIGAKFSTMARSIRDIEIRTEVLF